MKERNFIYLCKNGMLHNLPFAHKQMREDLGPRKLETAIYLAPKITKANKNDYRKMFLDAYYNIIVLNKLPQFAYGFVSYLEAMNQTCHWDNTWGFIEHYCAPYKDGGRWHFPGKTTKRLIDDLTREGILITGSSILPVPHNIYLGSGSLGPPSIEELEEDAKWLTQD